MRYPKLYKEYHRVPLSITTKEDKIYIWRPKINLKSFIPDIKLTGLDLILSGRIRGVQRAKSMVFSKGVVKVNSLAFPVQAKQYPVQTKWGKFGLKLWVGYL